MKTLISRLLAMAVSFFLLAVPVRADSYTFSWNSGFANAGALPDGNVTGWSDTRVLSGLTENTILDVDVTIQLIGGWNGDIYGYLTHSGGFSVLLNRVGVTSLDDFGYDDAGLNVRLDDSAINGDIHCYQSALGFASSITDGSPWSPDGRPIDPLSVTDNSSRTAPLSSFNGLDPNGSWTLFLADLSGGEMSTVANWGVIIEAESQGVSVPETGNSGLLLCIAVSVLPWFASRKRKRII